MNELRTFPISVATLTVDPVRRHIAGPRGDVAVEPLVMQLFLQLIDSQGEVLQRRELFKHLWGNAQVGDDSLNRLVVRLRKAIDRTGDGSVEIETVPRVGYRLLTGVTGSKSSPAVSRRSLVVAGASSLAVLAGAGLWQSRRNAQADVARSIDQGDILLRDAVPMQAGQAVPPLRSALERDPGNARALGLLALAEETRANNGGSANPAETLRAAEKAAKQALDIDPAEPHARLAMLDIKAAGLEWSEIEDELRNLLRAAPANVHLLGALTSFLQAAGRTRTAWGINEAAAHQAPSSPTPLWRRALRLWTLGREDRALVLSERLLQLWPAHALVWNARFMILAFSGRTSAAAAMLGNGVTPAGNAHPAKPEQWLPTLEAFAAPTRQNIARARDANLKAAQGNPGQATYAAMILSKLGEVDAAYLVMDALLLDRGALVANRPVVARSFLANAPSWCRTQWLFMPPLATIRRDPRFGPLCRDIGLARYWRDRGITLVDGNPTG